MNKPKFRAWDRETSEMIENPTVLEIWQGKPINEQFALEAEEKLIWMQYTGLKDKNGVEIYEGDILKTLAGNIQVVVFVIGSKTNVQDSRIAQFNCYDNRGYFHFDQNDEVIGNVYKDGDLLNDCEDTKRN